MNYRVTQLDVFDMRGGAKGERKSLDNKKNLNN
jgi:hypothetical protein